jgi:hypothetical protein
MQALARELGFTVSAPTPDGTIALRLALLPASA